GRENVHDLTPEEVAQGLAEGRVLLVDVREPNETEIERYPEAFYLPMSEFDPAAIPDPQGRRVVFAFRSGNRSVTASLMAQAAGLPYDAHFAGGIKAWEEVGSPTESCTAPRRSPSRFRCGTCPGTPFPPFIRWS